jgi:hypothetical protein
MPQQANTFRVLDYKLRNTAKSLKRWRQKFIGSVRLQLSVARLVVLRLDQEQDRRSLSVDEITLRSELKVKCLGLTLLARSITRQRS